MAPVSMLCATIHATLYAPSAHPPATASAPLPQPRSQAQPPAPQPSAQRRSAGRVVWCGQVASEAAPERPAMQAHPPSAGGCAQVSRAAPPPLPGGYRMGEKVFYMGVSVTFPSGDKLLHGGQGEVTGHATGIHRGMGVSVRFPGNKGKINLYLAEVRRLRAASAAHPPSACVCPGAPTPTASVAARAVAQRPGSGRASDAPRAVGVRPAGEGCGRGPPCSVRMYTC